ncbi:FAD-binding protein [Micromonospora sp. WMMA1363]|uniref:FAD-binding oxidoreductase n=1 Tax=Micromonospora sp. WMMA1363 TaxID=3053985 RepID=UPI00259C9C2D|nr:FAD-binding protein [Micromonospora sp. WMMA1363]MDM4719638.1 FAD-binding protein [Micromonospora sp. WMMA1363]
MTSSPARHQGRALPLPGSADFTDATHVFNLNARPEPEAAVTVRSVPEARETLALARERGMPVRVHSTGHGAGSVRPVRGGLLIRTDLSGGVRVDPARRTARVPAGTRWQEVVEAAAPHGLTAAHGSAGTVGVVGYVLGGGLSPYGRLVGLAANTVRAVELLTADGRLHCADEDRDPELFWALRGGGGGFGVVTAVEIELLPVAAVITGAAYWPEHAAERIIATWTRWATDAPREVTTTIRVMRLPPVPEVPPQLAGRTTVAVDGAVHTAHPTGLAAARRHAEDLLNPLRAIATPVLDTWSEGNATDVLRAHGDPAAPLPFLGDHMLLGDLDGDAIDRLLDAVRSRPTSPLVVAGLRQLGGAYGTPERAGGVLDRLDAAYSYAGSGPVLAPEHADAIRTHCDEIRRALRPWDTGRTVPCFVEDPDRPRRHISDEQMLSVARVRQRVDPEGLFREDVPTSVDSPPGGSSFL